MFAHNWTNFSHDSNALSSNRTCQFGNGKIWEDEQIVVDLMKLTGTSTSKELFDEIGWLKKT